MAFTPNRPEGAISRNVLVESYPVCMYDANLQKMVAVFRNASVASSYVFEKNKCKVEYKDVSRKRKYQPEANRFCRLLTFRPAKPDIIEQLAGRDYMILDSHYLYHIETYADKFKKRPK